MMMMKFLLVLVAIVASANALCSDNTEDAICFGDPTCSWNYGSSVCEDRPCEELLGTDCRSSCSRYIYGPVDICFGTTAPECNAYFVEGACSVQTGCTFHLSFDSPQQTGINTTGECIDSSLPRPCYLNDITGCALDSACIWSVLGETCEDVSQSSTGSASPPAPTGSSVLPPPPGSGVSSVPPQSSSSGSVQCASLYIASECEAQGCVFYPGAEICLEETDPAPACDMYMFDCPSTCTEYTFDTIYLCYDVAPQCQAFYLEGACDQQADCTFQVDMNDPSFGECLDNGAPVPCYLFDATGCGTASQCIYDTVTSTCNDAPQTFPSTTTTVPQPQTMFTTSTTVPQPQTMFTTSTTVPQPQTMFTTSTAPSVALVAPGLSVLTVAIVGVCVVIFSVVIAVAIVKMGKKNSVRVSPSPIMNFDDEFDVSEQTSNRRTSWAVQRMGESLA
eukprot:m.34579 g.34579  ORF g.34579 m.34579 type:complete len:448 (-) comp9935_c0_seq1:896-2239(-)